MDNNSNYKGSNFLINIFLWLLIEAALLYFFKPALNIFSFIFWPTVLVPFCSLLQFCFKKTKLKTLINTICSTLMVIFVLFVFIHSIGLEASTKSSSQIAKFSNDGEFSKSVIEITSPTDLPLIDKEAAFDIGSKLLTSNEQYAESYTLDSDVNLISYKDSAYMISPLEYNSFLNFDGIPGYILTNIYTGETEFIELSENTRIKYAPSAVLNQDLFRHLRFSYPFTILGDANFEIDNDGHPYYVVPTLAIKSVFLGNRYIKDVLVVDAVSGEIQKYSLSNVPEWVDNVYAVDRLMKEAKWHLDYNGSDHNVFLSANNPPMTRYETDQEYFEFAMNGHIYVYTGIKLQYAESNRNNIAFILGNLRTGEITYYSDYGIAETDAQTAAINLFPEDQYVPSRVLLVNIEGNPAYYLTLKNHLNHAEKYAFVNKTNPVFFVAGDSVDEALRSYYQTIGKRYPYSIEHDENETGIHDNTEPVIKEKTVTGTVSTVSSGTIDGNTIFLFTLNGNDEFFTSYLSINVEQLLKLIPDAKVTITYEVINEENIVNTITFK